MLSKQHGKRKIRFAKDQKARANSARVQRVDFDNPATMPSSSSENGSDSFTSATDASLDADLPARAKMSKTSC